MHSSAKTSFYNNCRMMLGVQINDNLNTSSHDATIAPIAGVEMIPKYRIIGFPNGFGAIQKVK